MLKHYNLGVKKLRYNYTKGKKALIGTGLILMLFLVLQLALNSRIFTVTAIEVRGNHLLGSEEVKTSSGISTGINTWRLLLRESARNLERHPVVERAVISRLLPGTVVIEVQERSPVALIPYEGSFIVIDRQGFFLQKEEELKGTELGVITGLVLNPGLLPGQQVQDPGLGPALAVLENLPPLLKLPLIEVAARDPQNLKLFFPGGPTVVLGTAVDLESKFASVRQLFLAEGQKGVSAGEIEYIDVGYPGTPVVKYLITNGKR